FPDSHQNRFQSVAGRVLGSSPKLRPIRDWQRLPVDLPIRNDRERLQFDEDRWQHVLGKAALQMRAQLGRCWVLLRFRNHVSDQPLAPRLVFPNYDDDPLDAGMAGQYGFNLA